MNLEIGGEFQFGDAFEILFEDFGFEEELVTSICSAGRTKGMKTAVPRP